jgi:hypothetical protein
LDYEPPYSSPIIQSGPYREVLRDDQFLDKIYGNKESSRKWVLSVEFSKKDALEVLEAIKDSHNASSRRLRGVLEDFLSEDE